MSLEDSRNVGLTAMVSSAALKIRFDLSQGARKPHSATDNFRWPSSRVTIGTRCEMEMFSRGRSENSSNSSVALRPNAPRCAGAKVSGR